MQVALTRMPLPRAQSAKDVRFIREVLDDAGGFGVKIISKIENEAGLRNIDEILATTDAVMVARGDLAMEVRWLSPAQAAYCSRGS
jgi:pyruvate kinase